MTRKKSPERLPELEGLVFTTIEGALRLRQAILTLGIGDRLAEFSGPLKLWATMASVVPDVDALVANISDHMEEIRVRRAEAAAEEDARARRRRLDALEADAAGRQCDLFKK